MGIRTLDDDQPFPLYGHEFKRCPYPTYAALREKAAVHQVEFPSGVVGWLVTGYHQAAQTLADPRLGKSHALGNESWRRLAAIMPEPQHTQLQVHLLHQDAPRHTVLRRLVADAVGPRRIASLRDQIARIADDLLDEITPDGRADLVSDFAARFSFAALSLVIGLPPRLQARFRREWCRVVQPVGPLSPARGGYIALLHGLQGYIGEVVDDSRGRGGDDLLCRLVQANDAGEIDDDELTSMIFQLLVAGQEPVTNQIATAVIALLANPDQLARLRVEPELLPRAVEELLRYDGAFELTTWRFFRDPSPLFDADVPAGDSVIVSLAAANRDPARFADADRLDLGRSPNPHLAFGHGSHFCVGAGLARVELQVAIGALLHRLPALQLAVPAVELEWIPAVLGRGVVRLPVTFQPSPPIASTENRGITP